MSRLTHRSVAKIAKVPLAATTYHYATKTDMLADASQRLLDGHLAAYRQAIDHQRRGVSRYKGLNDFIAQFVASAAESDRRAGMAWCEIMLDAARSEEGHKRARAWFDELIVAWRGLASAMGETDDPCYVQTAIDYVIGLYFTVLPLGLSADNVKAVLRDGADPIQVWHLGSVRESRDVPDDQLTAKAQATRARILDSAISLLINQGAGAVTYRGVAEAGGLALTAPAYYFKSITELLQLAESELFRATKNRWRQMLSPVNLHTISLDGLVDLTSVVFIRDATEFRSSSVALFSTWLEAERNPALRREAYSAIVDQVKAWRHRLAGLYPSPKFDGLRMYAIYLGKLVRVIASGAPVDQLALARQEFRQAITTTLGCE
jgi:DNA-binding transcriptional regulator YbjK